MSQIICFFVIEAMTLNSHFAGMFLATKYDILPSYQRAGEKREQFAPSKKCCRRRRLQMTVEKLNINERALYGPSSFACSFYLSFRFHIFSSLMVYAVYSTVTKLSEHLPILVDQSFSFLFFSFFFFAWMMQILEAELLLKVNLALYKSIQACSLTKKNPSWFILSVTRSFKSPLSKEVAGFLIRMSFRHIWSIWASVSVQSNSFKKSY